MAIQIDIYDRDDLATVVASLTGPGFDRSWRDQLNDVGAWSASVGIDDSAAVDLVNGRVVKFAVGGADLWAGLIEHQRRVLVSQSEEVEQIIVASGPGVLAVLEEGIVYPALGIGSYPIADTRFFNFASPDLDDSGWDAAVEKRQVSAANGAVWYWDFFPTSWPDPTAFWIWSRAWPDPALPADPVGVSYFRKTITLAADTTMRVWAAADDGYQLWFDGVPLFADSDPPNFAFATPHYADVMASAGDHVVAARVENFARDVVVGNIAALLVAIYELDGDGSMATLIDHTDDSWLTLDYPSDPPGFTPGQVFNILLDEAQARGALTDVTRDFDDAVDADAVAWPTSPDISVAVGRDLRSFALQMTEAFVDVAMTPDLVLRLWQQGGRGGASGVTLAAGVNVTALEVEGEG